MTLIPSALPQNMQPVTQAQENQPPFYIERASPVASGRAVVCNETGCFVTNASAATPGTIDNNSEGSGSNQPLAAIDPYIIILIAVALALAVTAILSVM